MSAIDPSDPLSAASRGDAGAIDALLARHLPGVRRFVARQAGAAVASNESISDLVQSTCREVLERAKDGRFELKTEEAFRDFLYRAALMKVLNRHRFWNAERREAARKEDLADEAVAAAEGPSPSRSAEVNEELERFAHSFARLDDGQRALVVMAHVEGLSHREIGERLGLSEAHSRTKLSRALARLARLATERRA